jgi:hypothetical protein
LDWGEMGSRGVDETMDFIEGGFGVSWYGLDNFERNGSVHSRVGQVQ